MIGPRSTTLLQKMNLFDQIPGIVGDRLGNAIADAAAYDADCERELQAAHGACVGAND